MASPSTLSRVTDSRSVVSQRLLELLSQRQGSFEDALAIVRKQDLEQAEETTRLRALAAGRCPICTLPIPCRHFESVKAAAAVGWKKPLDTQESRVDRSMEGLPSERLSARRGEKAYRVRYRSANDIFYSYSDRTRSLREPKRRISHKLKLMEKLDLYREAKYKREIERIEEQMKLETELQQERERKEQNRIKRNAQLKASLVQHRNALFQSEQTRAAAAAQATADLRKSEARKQLYLRRQVMVRQKERVEEYHKRKRMIEGIQRDQVGDLGES